MKKRFKKRELSGGLRNLLILLCMVGAGFGVLVMLNEYSHDIKTLSHTEFMRLVDSDEVKKVQVSGGQVEGRLKDGSRFETMIVNTPSTWDSLQKHNIDVSVLPVSESYSSSTIALIIGIIASIGLLVLYFLRQSKSSSGGAGGIFSMGKSRAQVFMPSMIKENFASVAGATEAKKELQDLVAFLRSPEKFERLGAKMPRGVLLVGEPGTGKTLLARAVAGEAQVPFFSISGSDFMEVFVGVGAARVRDLFAQARKHAPSIIFIDEIDAIGRHRGSGLGSGHDEREQTLNQLLIEMDGFATGGDSVIVIAATNKPDVLDKALLRPGRFDRRVNVPYPDQASRRHMLEILTRHITLAADVNLDSLADKTHGFNGADLKNIVNKAAMHASKEGKSAVDQHDFTTALNQVIQEARTISSTDGKLKLFMPATIKETFNVFAGAPEVKEELVELVDILKNPEKYRRLGATVTRGVLLDGKPGTGKTLLARAVAGEAHVPFFTASGSEFVEKYVGVGAARVRALFEEARKYAPSIIFIDEIDAIGAKRTEHDGHSEHNQTLNQLLTEMDGFDSRKDLVIVIAATNRKDILDPALLRAGRFDRTVHVPLPNQHSRHAILQVHAARIKLDPEVDLYKLARGTPGASGADLANLINEAALCASRHNHDAVKNSDFDEARDRMILGKENRTLMLTDEDKKMTAYHEAGHALVGILMGNKMDPLYKVTIIPRGPALGVTHFLPERDKHSENKDEMVADVMTCLGGRIAEQLVFNQLSSGAYSDFTNANELVQKMVRYYGMSEELGQVVYTDPRMYSQATAQKIDEEVRRIMKEAYDKTHELLRANRDKLDILAQALLDKETIDAFEAYNILGLPQRVVTTWHDSPATKEETPSDTVIQAEEPAA